MRMPFGKFCDTLIEDLPDHYLEWLYGLDNLKEPLRTAVDQEYAARFLTEKSAPSAPMMGFVSQIIDLGYRALAKQLHPDRGGDENAMKELNAAIAWLRGRVKELERD